MKMPKIENIGIILSIVIIMLLFSYFILGFSGMMTVFGVIILFMLPIYIALNRFELGQDEKIIFSFFIGVGVFPSITYWLGMLISFRIAVAITFIILVVGGYLSSRFGKGNS